MKAIDDLERYILNEPEPIDADEVIPNVWQGGMAPPGEMLQRAGFKSLVLSAKEHQPSQSNYVGMRVLRVPLEDDGDPLSQQEWDAVLVAALWVAERAAVEPVLVTCMAGWNRSGLINACAIRILTNCGPEDAIRQVQRRRLRALNNESFKWEIRNKSDTMVMGRLEGLQLRYR